MQVLPLCSLLLSFSILRTHFSASACSRCVFRFARLETRTQTVRSTADTSREPINVSASGPLRSCTPRLFLCVSMLSSDGSVYPPARVSERAEGRRKPTRKRKTMKRCTSPSHFALSAEEELKYGADYTLDLPSRERVDQLLRHVAAFYYKPKELHPNGINVWVDNEYDQSVYPTLDLLLSPLRRPSPRENWSNREVAIFEAGLCKIGKRFGEISRMIKTKTTNQVVAFYYTFWKKHEHYRAWKGQRNEQQQEGAAARASAGTTQPQQQSQTRATSTRGTSDGAARSATAATSAAGSAVPATAASAAAASIPPSLVSSRQDSSHPRIRMVDSASGQEYFFILPIVGDEVALQAMQRGIEADEREAEKMMAAQQRRQEQETTMEDEQQQQETETAATATTPTTERTKRTTAARPPRPTSARSPSPSAAASSASAAPLAGFRCILPALGDSSRTCNKFFTSTNSLGSHLFMTHKLTKATAGGIEKGYYIQCVK